MADKIQLMNGIGIFHHQAEIGESLPCDADIDKKCHFI